MGSDLDLMKSRRRFCFDSGWGSERCRGLTFRSSLVLPGRDARPQLRWPVCPAGQGMSSERRREWSAELIPMRLIKIDPRALKENPDRSRQTRSTLQADALLLATIKAVGIVQPTLVTPKIYADNGYVIDAGDRRVKRAIGVALAQPVRQIKKLRLLATVLPAMLDQMAKGDMPEEQYLRTIATASLDEQKEVWKKHKPSKADTQARWRRPGPTKEACMRVTPASATIWRRLTESSGSTCSRRPTRRAATPRMSRPFSARSTNGCRRTRQRRASLPRPATSAR